MFPTSLPCRVLVLIGRLALLSVLVASMRATPSEWPDGRGKTFKGEPADIVGPYAVFRTGSTSGRIIPLRALKPEECVRFYREAATLRTFDDATQQDRGRVYRDLAGRVLSRRDGKLVPYDLAQHAEPLVYVLLWHHPRDNSFNEIVNTFLVQYRRLRQVYPDWVEAVTLTGSSDGNGPRQQHERGTLPWLMADPKKQSQMKALDSLAAVNASSIVAVSRSGVPLMACGGHDEEELRDFMDRLAQLLHTVSPENPRFWRDRLYYLHAVRPVEFATGRAEPLLIGSPFNLDAMRKYRIARVRAKLEVNPDGRVKTAVVQPEEGQHPRVAVVLADVLKNGLVFAPAVENGQFVPGTFDYTYEVPPADPMKDAVAAWLTIDKSKEYPLKHWLVLKTFKVEDQIDLATNRVEADGTVVLNAVRASGEHATKTSQKNAFASDWFTPEQAAALHPVAGEKQIVNDVPYTWKKFTAVGHAVDLSSGFGAEEYCYCYAWAEIEVPEDQNAILGFGSDDGVKMWLNGELVLDRWIQRPLRIDEDVMPLKLKKGKNQLMLKVQNIYGYWRFSTRLILLPNPTQAGNGQ